VTTTCPDFLPLIEEEVCKQILYDSLAFVNKNMLVRSSLMCGCPITFISFVISGRKIF
jgi:hypothetical protein